MRHPINKDNTVGNRRFRSLFGVPPRICAAIWAEISIGLGASSKPDHLLYSLVFLRQGLTEHVSRIICDALDEKTLRKHVHCIIDAIDLYLTHVVRRRILKTVSFPAIFEFLEKKFF